MPVNARTSLPDCAAVSGQVEVPAQGPGRQSAIVEGDHRLVGRDLRERELRARGRLAIDADDVLVRVDVGDFAVIHACRERPAEPDTTTVGVPVGGAWTATVTGPASAAGRVSP